MSLSPDKENISFSKHALECAAIVKKLLSDDLGHHFTITKLSRKVGINATTLKSCFKHVNGMTIFEFGQNIRLEFGRKLLLETHSTLQTIAEECGYQEQSNFGTAFRKKFGIGPGEWRKKK